MKYGVWQVAAFDPAAAARLQAGGFSPLTAAVLCSRGYDTPEAASAFLRADLPLIDPMLLRDMDKTVARVRLALRRREKIVVFGDYDVDGITATTLLTDFLRWQGGDCTPYIPGRLEEGYGLNEPAIRALREQGADLILTVDCGITAVEAAAFCRSLGVDLCVTDHHECKEILPDCVSVVDPHRKDDDYPHWDLSGVGVAFKLAAAIHGDQEAILDRYSDLLCLGTIADVMSLRGENRTFVARGLQALQTPKRMGLRALMKECGCDKQPVTAGTVGYVLSPRINAAGRMGQVPLALRLFLTEDPQEAADLAQRLCALNRERQAVESAIYHDAVAMLPDREKPYAIVLSDEHWHQGVVGIVASRLAEEFRCPTFLICPDGEKGKASSRSYGGFNLFSALEALSPLLEDYGGHELAAGFTIGCGQIDEFRREITRLSREFQESGRAQSALQIDCAVEPALLTLQNVSALEELEPCGAGCPRPVFFMDQLRVDQLSEVGGGKHLRLRLTRGASSLSAIFFSTTALCASVGVGDTVEIAFTPQINEFRGNRTVQLNLVDIRPAGEHRELCSADEQLYRRHLLGDLRPEEAGDLLPARVEFVALWRYLVSHSPAGNLQDTCTCLSRKVARYAGVPCRPGHTRICLDVFRELGLLSLSEHQRQLHIIIASDGRKVNLDQSEIIKRLKKRKSGE
ncbi:MAG: single-stranded-DNA-specific exonuclease RecJ [Oscillospiraceae bacterium]|nr:single-stranded-DNA-specific exonuclease RecJ [Oscillospiraceae bacterium]